MNASIRHRFLTGIILVIISPLQAAWVRASGETYVALGASYTSANGVYDNSGTKQAIPRFTEIATNIYGEYGLTEKLTLGYGIPLLFNNSAEDTALMQTQRKTTGLGDSLFASRYQLYSGAVLLSAGLDIGLPTGSKNADVPTGDGEFNFIPKLYAAGGFNAGLNWFYLTSAGFNKRTLNFSDEVHASAMLGATIGPVVPMASIELRHSLRNGDAGALSNSPLLINNTRFLSWSAGLMYKITERLNVNAFVKGAFYVQNILAAGSVSVGVGYLF